MSTHAGTSSFARALASSLRQRTASAPPASAPPASVPGSTATAKTKTPSTPSPGATGSVVEAGRVERWQWSRTVVGGVCFRLWEAWQAKRVTVQRGKQLRLVETVNLGEKRFAAILAVGQQQFLVGGGTAGISLLARLDEAAEQQAPPASEIARSPWRASGSGLKSASALRATRSREEW